MTQALATLSRQPVFEASLDDIKKQMRTDGWGFWRGVVIGFLSSFPLAHIAVAGEVAFGL
ncbi:MAG: hypothetical protein JWR08_570 [Enterovirga sp.]|jgi:hypothetical protein|nr:hypothetical protein [Enterovirga sp.]